MQGERMIEKQDQKLTRFHSKHAREGFLSVLQRSVPIVENADAVPQFGILVELSVHESLCTEPHTLGFGNR